MILPLHCMGLPRSQIVGPVACGLDVAFGMYDFSMVEWVRPRPGLVLPRLVWYGKLEDERAAMFLCRQYRARSIVIDSRPDATIASRFQKDIRKTGIKCWRAQYSPTYTGNRKLMLDEKEGLVTLDRTMTLDSVFQYVLTGTMGMPQNFKEIASGNFSGEMCASGREPVVWHGIPTFQWKNSGDDHAFHSLGYALTASELCNLHELPVGELLPQKGIVVGSVSQYMDDEDEEEQSHHWREAGVA